MSNKKLFKKIMLYMSIILSVSTTILCFITLSYFSNIYKQEVNNYNSKILSQVQEIIDLYLIREIEYLQSNIISLLMFDEDFINFVNEESISSISVLNMYNKIKDMKNKNNLIEDISIYSYNSNTIISSSGVKYLNDRKNDTLGEVPWKKYIEESNSSKSWFQHKVELVVPYEFKTENFIYFLVSYPLSSSAKQRKAIVSIGIKESSIYDNMTKIVSEDFGQIFVIDSNKRIVSHANKEFIGTQPKDVVFLDRIEGQMDAGFLVDSLDGRQVVVNFKSSDYYDWKYIVVDDYDIFYYRSRFIRIFVLFVYGIVLLFGTGLVILCSKKIYEPFKGLVQYANKILDKTSELDVNIDDMDEINIIDKALEQMSHNIESLQEFVESKKNILRRVYFNGLIGGEADFKNISTPNMTQLGVHFNYEKFLLIILDIINDHAGQKDIREVESNELIAFIEGQLLEKNIISYGFTTYNNEIAIIVNYEEDNDKDLIEIWNYLREAVEKKFNINITMGISGNTNELNNISMLYEQAIEALSYKFVDNNADIFYYNQLLGQKSSDDYLGLKLDYVSSLMRCIKSGNRDKVEKAIKLIAEHLLEDGHTIEAIKEYIVFIAADLTKLAYDLGYSEKQVFGTNVIQDFIDISNINELESKLEYYCYRFIEFLENQRKEKDLILVQEAINYMKQNISNDDISLLTVADFVGVSPSLLSKIFKQQTGMNFVDYCINLRLEYAQKLLEEGNLKIEEISQIVGYSQTQYFIKKFKEKYGLTPKQYQMKFLYESNVLTK